MLSIMMAMLCGTLFARTAPVMPDPVPYVSGQTYYLYNVRAGLFLGTSTNSPSCAGLSNEAREVEMTTVEGQDYITVKFVDNNRYLYTVGSTLFYDDTYNYHCNFRLNLANNGYYLQRGYSYQSNEYVGRSNLATDELFANITDTASQIVWQLIAGDDDGDMYVARLDLFNLLIKAEQIGLYIADYDAMYNNTSSTISQIKATAIQLRSALNLISNNATAEWSEYPIRFSSDGKWRLYNNNGDFETSNYLKDDSTFFYATFVVDTVSTISYNIQTDENTKCYIYLDNELIRTLDGYRELSASDRRWFTEVEKGVHTLTWKFVDMSGSNVRPYVREVGIQATPTIAVDLLEPGSLGTEVLYQVNHIKDVRKLVVSGTLNDDDWEKIGMMTNLYSLDLSQASATTIKARMFECNRSSSNPKFWYLHKVVLPQNVKTIGDNAFRNSFIDSIALPNTLESIGEYAISNTLIQEVTIPKGITSIPNRAFYDCYSLRKVILPQSLRSIGTSAFSYNYNLSDCILPDSLTFIGESAFFQNLRYNVRFPESLQSIEPAAFYQCSAIDSILIPDNVTSVGYDAFHSCSNATYAKVPNQLWRIESSNIFGNCTSLRDVRLESSTMIVRERSYTIGASLNNITLHVPDYLVNSYKLDPYWYDAKAIVGFSTSERDRWTIYNDLTMNARDRYQGTPTVIHYNGAWKINGDSAMHFSYYDVWYNRLSYNYYYKGEYFSGDQTKARVISNCPNITVDSATITTYAESKQWQFLSMPIDFIVGDITPWEVGTMYVVYRYDGARRAANGAGSSWVRCADTDTIHVGEGFILQASQDSWMKFAAVNNTASNIFTSSDINVPLQHHEATVPSNSNWNLVGNPYQCWYNNHMLNFTAPITVWNHSNRTYEAYSLSDDDYAIRPNEAFFVQCPEAFNSIGFPTTGRQFTSEIISQNAAPMRAGAVATEREIINLVISDGEMSDRTRLVYNELASVDFESTCDAGKVMSMDTDVPQIYTIEADGEFAINERPLGDGIAMIGFYAPTTGEYTISMQNSDEHIYLFDHVLNIVTDLSTDCYTFSSNAGIDNERFTTQHHAPGISTAIDSETEIAPIAFGLTNAIHIANMIGDVFVYTMDGFCVSKALTDGQAMDIPSAQGVYLVRNNNAVIKVCVK